MHREGEMSSHMMVRQKEKQGEYNATQHAKQ